MFDVRYTLGIVSLHLLVFRCLSKNANLLFVSVKQTEQR